MATSRLCSIPDCGKPHRCKGYCVAHYQRFRLYGDPLAGGAERRPQSHECEIEGCGGSPIGRNLCARHYGKWLRYGTPFGGTSMKTPRGALSTFIQQVVLTYQGEECLLWPYSTAGNGYGAFYQNGRTTYVHRFVCAEVNGPAPTPKHQVAHSCGKGHLGCVAPSHLRWATKKENEHDKFLHGTRVPSIRSSKCRTLSP